MRTSFLSLPLLATSTFAAYVLEDDYSSDAFASMFDFFTVSPTLGRDTLRD